MDTDWKARSEREAAALLQGAGVASGVFVGYEDLVRLCATAWIEGRISGLHRALQGAELASSDLKEELT